MDLLNEVYKTVKKIDGEVGQLLQWKAAHVVGHESVERDVKEVRDCLFEKNGIVSRMQGLQGCKNSIKDKAVARRQFILGVLSKVLAAGIIAFMTWAILSWSGS